MIRILIIILINIPWRSKFVHYERMPKKGGFVVAMNHSQKIDPLHIMGYERRVVHWLAKQELFDTKIGAWFHLNMEEIPVNRQARDNNKAIEKAVQALKDGEIIGIFPEGTTKPINMRPLLKPHTGVARLALLAEVPVVPMGIAGNLDAFRKKSPKWGLEKQWLIVGKPMTFEKYYGQHNDRDVLRKVTEEIMEEVDRLIDEGDSLRLGKKVRNAGKGRDWENEDKVRGTMDKNDYSRGTPPKKKKEGKKKKGGKKGKKNRKGKR